MSCLKDVEGIKFAVVAQDILDPDMNESILKLKAINQDIKLLVVCDDCCKCQTNALFILEEDTRQQVLEKFQSFFYDDNEENTESNSDLLSEREVDVLKAVALGYSNKEIAEKLFISINTVISHRKNITEKLGIKTIAGLTVYAVMNDLIKPENVKG
ncbi:helix-turn-helix transcriptional regulator [Carboxylicivirga sp. A043]|nr:helix-turn-helix transcriptional regulator [Carboxylicivirga sp. A043]